MDLLKKVFALLVLFLGCTIGMFLFSKNPIASIGVIICSAGFGIYLYLLGTKNVNYELLEKFVRIGILKLVTWTTFFLLIYIMYFLFFSK